MFKFFTGLFDSNDKQLKKAQPIIDKINSYEEEIIPLSEISLKEKTEEFRKRLNIDLSKARQNSSDFKDVSKIEKQPDLDKEREALTNILPEAYAVVREASKRATNHRHFDVQMMAGYFLFTNKIVELFTGEGKTLAANMPLYLYALTGKGAHLVTVNDYLARRDAEWTGHIMNLLGVTVAAVNNETQFRFISDEEAIKLKGDEARKQIEERKRLFEKAGFLKYNHMSGVNLIECSKKEAYACDIVYGTNNEFGFDYLRDNMVRDIDDRVQGPLHYAIVDEADSILIDEARTPLIISQGAQQSNKLYSKFASIVKSLKPEEDYIVDEKMHSVVPTEKGISNIEKALGVKNIYESSMHAYHLENALKAQALYTLDDEYIIRDGEILIVDEFTGRVLQGRRYSEGLHQAIEAKEGVEIKRESKTLATITLQNYFRLYDFMAGMTGTALTEAEEFSNIYKLDVIVVPTNKPVVRKDNPDVVYRSVEGKFNAIVEDIKAHNETGQPVLVGTTSVEKSELIANLLAKDGVPHNVLNAKFHESESKIVAEAGKKGMVTIATNMAGRGTDIALGEGVKELGGLYIIGSERHESRRIDNQLRGRSGRQGDPGESQFFVSFEDDLMRIFGGENMKAIMSSVGMDDNMPISAGILGRTIESAQKKVEAHNYDIRKNLVEYDDVLNQQREIIYGIRRRILSLIKHEFEINKELLTTEYKEIKIKPQDIQVIDFDNIISQIDRFSIKNSETYKISGFENFKGINTPISMYLLKKIIDYGRLFLSAQLSDDMKVDNEESRKFISQLKAFVTADLSEVCAVLLGYKDSTDMYQTIDQENNYSKKSDIILKLLITAFIFHANALGPRHMLDLSRMLILQTMDNVWMEHLDTMGDLREGISLRSLAQREPLVEYKNEGFRMFDEMLAKLDETVVTSFYKVRLVKEDRNLTKGDEVKSDPTRISDSRTDNRPGKVGGPVTRKQSIKVGRNDPCPCGSGKKYKKCCYPKYGG